MSHKYCINQFLNFDFNKRKSVNYASFFKFHIIHITTILANFMCLEILIVKTYTSIKVGCNSLT